MDVLHGSYLEGRASRVPRQSATRFWVPSIIDRLRWKALATKEFIDASGRRKVKGNMHIELAVNALELAEHIDQMVLFSGDGDFRSLAEAVQRRGVHVTVVSTISSQPPMIADELRRQADVFTDLLELKSKIGRDPSERPAPREPRYTRHNSCSVRPRWRRGAMTTISTIDRAGLSAIGKIDKIIEGNLCEASKVVSRDTCE